MLCCNPFLSCSVAQGGDYAEVDSRLFSRFHEFEHDWYDVWLCYAFELTFLVNSLEVIIYGGHEIGEFVYDLAQGGFVYKWAEAFAFG